MTMALADRVTAVALFALGVSMAVGGWTMDRLEIRQIHPASIPGLVPMILGVLMALCAVLLWRSARTDEERASEPFLAGGSWSRLGLTAALGVFYALVLVGTLPFFWATALFVSAFALVFSGPGTGGVRARAVRWGGAVALGLGVALATSVLFEQVFLVRLP